MRLQEGVVDPSSFKRAVDAATPQYSGSGQQDAHEFLVFLLDSLHEEMKLELEHTLNISRDMEGDRHGKRRRLIDDHVLTTEGDVEAARDAAVDRDEIQQMHDLDQLLPTSRQFEAELQVCFKCCGCGDRRFKTVSNLCNYNAPCHDSLYTSRKLTETSLLLSMVAEQMIVRARWASSPS
jgi:uncharacterized UBP type Zn finger protein